MDAGIIRKMAQDTNPAGWLALADLLEETQPEGWETESEIWRVRAAVRLWLEEVSTCAFARMSEAERRRIKDVRDRTYHKEMFGLRFSFKFGFTMHTLTIVRPVGGPDVELIRRGCFEMRQHLITDENPRRERHLRSRAFDVAGAVLAHAERAAHAEAA